MGRLGVLLVLLSSLCFCLYFILLCSFPEKSLLLQLRCWGFCFGPVFPAVFTFQRVWSSQVSMGTGGQAGLCAGYRPCVHTVFLA